jgi:hypothetical protein
MGRLLLLRQRLVRGAERVCRGVERQLSSMVTMAVWVADV